MMSQIERYKDEREKKREGGRERLKEDDQQK